MKELCDPEKAWGKDTELKSQGLERTPGNTEDSLERMDFLETRKSVQLLERLEGASLLYQESISNRGGNSCKDPEKERAKLVGEMINKTIWLAGGARTGCETGLAFSREGSGCVKWLSKPGEEVPQFPEGLELL